MNVGVRKCGDDFQGVLFTFLRHARLRRTPAPREEALANLFKSVGGRLIGWYPAFGRHDWLVIGERRRQSRHR
jgi:uncharacterized protein with GYD domain